MSVALSGLSIQIPDTLYAGQVITAIARLIPANATSVTISWSSDNTSVATVNQSGVVTVNSISGSSSFNLTITDTYYSQSVNITVLPKISTFSFALSTVNTSIGYIIPANPIITWNDGASRSTNITYVSSDPNITPVDSNGNITILAKGNSTIVSGSINNQTTKYASTIINVQNRPNASLVTISGGYVYLTNISVGKFSQAYLVVYPYNVQLSTIVWSSSDTTVAYVDASTGIVMGVSDGSCVISATIGNSINTIIISSNVTACATVIDSIILTPPAISGLQISSQYTSTLSGVFSFFPNTATFPRPSWISLNPAIATVNANYSTNTLTITGIANGTTGVSVVSTDSQSISTVMIVSVENGLDTITANTIPSTFLIGKTFQATLIASGTNSMVGYYSAVQWSSNNQSILTVSATGVITAVGSGTTTISVIASGQSGTATYSKSITVYIGVNSITLNPSSVNLEVGSTTTINPTIFPTNAENKTIIWTSSKPTVATVDASGNILGVASGTAIISASADDGSNKSSSTSVSVGMPITSASIIMPSTTVYLGSPVQASITLNPIGSAADFVYWNPSLTAITTYEINTIQQVTDTGIVVPGGPGSSTFNIYAGNQFGNIISTVSPLITVLIPVKAILVNPKKTMTIGTTSSIAATIVPANATDSTLSWTTASSRIATVDSASGLITANNSGTTYITATSTDGTNISVTTVLIVS